MQLTAARRTITVDAQGVTHEKLEPVATIVPGEEVVYSVTCENRGDAPAAEIVVTLPIPPEMRLVVEPPAHAGASTTVSVDGGANFGPLATLTITSDSGAVRSAHPGDVNAVRWTLHDQLAPGEKRIVNCRAVLR